MIIFHPCTDQFDKEHHAPYVEFFHDVLPADARRRGACTRSSRRSSRPTPRTSRCTGRGTRTTPPTRSSCGTGARPAASTSGGSSSWAPTTTTSPSSSAGRRREAFHEALAMASGSQRDPEITMLHIPPIVMADVAVLRSGDGAKVHARRLARRARARASSSSGAPGFSGRSSGRCSLDRYPNLGRIFLVVRPKGKADAGGAVLERNGDERGARAAEAVARRRLRGLPPRQDRPDRRRHGAPALRSRRRARARAPGHDSTRS